MLIFAGRVSRNWIVAKFWLRMVFICAANWSAEISLWQETWLVGKC